MSMNAIRPMPSVEYLRECLEYDPASGIMLWIERPRHHFSADHWWKRQHHVDAGREAFNTRAGKYLVGKICQVSYYKHRIAWKWMAGREPLFLIDHDDQDGTNNRWSNLREATNSENVVNGPMRAHNKSGIQGIFSYRGRWRAVVTKDSKIHYLGDFDDIEVARAAHGAKARELYGEFHAFAA